MQRVDVESVAPGEDDPRAAFVREPRVRMEGMRVVATGGLGTLAASFARTAARAGASVVLVDLLKGTGPARDAAVRAGRLAWELDELGASHEFYHADVCDPRQTWDVFQEIAALGVPDVVANFAGTHHPPFDLAAVDDAATLAAMAEEFARVSRVNLAGAFHVTAAVASAMVARRSGHVIHLCSNGSRASLYGSYAYNASKHGVEALVKTAAAQLAPFGVRVNGVAPGTVVTDLNRALMFDEEGQPKPRARSILAHTPTKRFATPDGVAETVLAMCVPQRHFTGNVVFCDDGYAVEGHSWPEGNAALYEGGDALDRLYSELDRLYPRSGARPEVPPGGNNKGDEL